MASLNRVILIGNLGKDPDIKYSQAGLAIVNFSLATTEKIKEEQKTEWHNIVVFGKLAEVCGKYLSKGKQVYIEGRIQTEEWTDKDGVKRYTTKIIANQMIMLGVKGEEKSDVKEDKHQKEMKAYESQKQDDDLPF